jgi:hypothetical protein
VTQFKLQFTPEADSNLSLLENNPSLDAQYKAVTKCLGYMETNLRHPSLHTHKLKNIQGKNGEEIFEAYAQNDTPSAYRVIWHYGPERGVITIVAIVPHL